MNDGGGFTPFSFDCLGGSWDPIELEVIQLKVKLFGESKWMMLCLATWPPRKLSIVGGETLLKKKEKEK